MTELTFVFQSRLINGLPKSCLINDLPKSLLINDLPKSLLIYGLPKSRLINDLPKSHLINGLPKSRLINGLPKSCLIHDYTILTCYLCSFISAVPTPDSFSVTPYPAQNLLRLFSSTSHLCVRQPLTMLESAAVYNVRGPVFDSDKPQPLFGDLCVVVSSVLLFPLLLLLVCFAPTKRT
jgi:hypothetical protein